MQKLIDYVLKYSDRGECACGHCVDAPSKPEEKQPSGHVADMIFFKVKAKEGANSSELKKLVQDSVEGTFTNINMFDGKEHSFIEVGAWIGDQGTALILMGLGSLLGLWNLLTPKTMLPTGSASDEMLKQMAGAGYITVQSKKE